MIPNKPAITYIAGFLEPAEASEMQSRLGTEIGWEQHRIRLFGREVHCPRLSAWHGDPGAAYGYSGVRYDPAAWTPTLSQLRTLVETAAGNSFNSVLLNLYRDGSDTMGWHADDERELGPRPVIASLSLGEPRKFRFRHREDHGTTYDIWLGHGSLLIMHGSVQSAWHHALPRSKRVRGERMNLTFRRVLQPSPSAGDGEAT